MIVWNVKPELLSFGGMTIRWYGVLFAVAFLLGFELMKVAFRRDQLPLRLLDPLFVYMMVGTVAGARLGHTLFYEPDVYLAHPWRILKVWEGGLASHGAAIGITLSLWLFSRRYRVPLRGVLDEMSTPVALAGGLIRLGNLFNSEIMGRPTDLPWAFVFPRVDQVPRHPTQIYESLAYLGIFGLLLTLNRRPAVRARAGFRFGVFLALVFGFRFFVEFLKENQVAFESRLPLDLGQLLSIPVVLIGIVLILRARPSARKGDRSRPGSRPSPG